jgi:hypothetical protein
MAGKSDQRQNIGITEFATAYQGALSPFGDELPLPLPVEAIHYQHPRPDELPAPAVDTDGARRRGGH